MDRDALHGLCAALNVAQAMLDEAGLREAGRHANAAVVAVHRDVRWTGAELARMAEAQAWAIERLGAGSFVRRGDISTSFTKGVPSISGAGRKRQR